MDNAIQGTVEINTERGPLWQGFSVFFRYPNFLTESELIYLQKSFPVAVPEPCLSPHYYPGLHFSYKLLRQTPG